MLGHLARVLEQVAADADVRLSQLELLGEAERALVLEEWNRTDAEYRGVVVHPRAVRGAGGAHAGGGGRALRGGVAHLRAS